jgi:hypothetical protein
MVAETIAPHKRAASFGDPKDVGTEMKRGDIGIRGVLAIGLKATRAVTSFSYVDR